MGMLISKRRKAQRKKAADSKGQAAPKAEAFDIVTDEGVFVDVTEESLIEDGEEVITDQHPKKKGKK